MHSRVKGFVQDRIGVGTLAGLREEKEKGRVVEPMCFPPQGEHIQENLGPSKRHYVPSHSVVKEKCTVRFDSALPFQAGFHRS